MNIFIVTDAWEPLVNGVVRTFVTMIAHLRQMGHAVSVISPDQFTTVPCPTYPEIRLAIVLPRHIAERIDRIRPDAIHIVTEGPLGLAARTACLKKGIPFTTSYTTRFPEYVHERIRLPLTVGYSFMRWFHAPASRVMVSTCSFKQELESRGIRNLVLWGRGVDTTLFAPLAEKPELGAPRPYLLYVGRVAVEKNLRAFLSLDVPGTKFIVGDGPQRARLAREFPEARFVGMRHGADLAYYYAAADVFVLPSRTETFGLVMLEALASGVPVAAYPCQATKEVIGDSGCGVLDEDLGKAVLSALNIPAERCRCYAQRFGWEKIAEIFVANLALIDKRRYT